MISDTLADFFDGYNFDCKLKQLLDEHTMGEIVDCILWRMEGDYQTYKEAVILARDFYISSDLTKKEKGRYYSVLKRKGFFIKLNEYLYAREHSYADI